MLEGEAQVPIPVFAADQSLVEIAHRIAHAHAGYGSTHLRRGHEKGSEDVPIVRHRRGIRVTDWLEREIGELNLADGGIEIRA